MNHCIICGRQTANSYQIYVGKEALDKSTEGDVPGEKYLTGKNTLELVNRNNQRSYFLEYSLPVCRNCVYKPQIKFNIITAVATAIIGTVLIYALPAQQWWWGIIVYAFSLFNILFAFSYHSRFRKDKLDNDLAADALGAHFNKRLPQSSKLAYYTFEKLKKQMEQLGTLHPVVANEMKPRPVTPKIVPQSQIPIEKQPEADQAKRASLPTDEKRKQALQTLKTSPSWEMRRDALKELKGATEEEIIDAAIHALKTDEMWVVRFNAAEMLGTTGDTRAVAPLIEALKDPKEAVREYAGKALGELGDERTITPMIKALAIHGADYTGVNGIADGLGMMGTKAVTQLMELLDGPEMGLALRALEKGADKQAEEKLLAIAEDPGIEEYLRIRAVIALGNIPETGDRLTQLLQKEGSDKLVKSILNALEKIGYKVENAGSLEKEAKRRSAQKLLEGMKAIKIGMKENDADELVGYAVFGMGANQVHKTPYGDFQLIVNHGIVTGTFGFDPVIKKIEEFLQQS
ncbi:MAG: HEAT repeat domain-containing protein [Bacteroidales bacterium]|jgi:HEAT repeat protein|nr:HEAT repeat domain-containing protein [Bacteroidales bacterium]